MKVNEYYSYDKSELTALKISDAGPSLAGLKQGDILEGVVSEVDSSVKISFKELADKEISFDKKSVKNAYVGEKRRFEVVEAGSDKIVLRDLGVIGSEIEARSILSAQVDMSMPRLVEGFKDTMDDEDDDGEEAIKRLSDDDYYDMKAEGFSIEDYKADRLIRALARIKTNRAAQREYLDGQETKIKESRRNTRRQAAKAVAEKYEASVAVAEALAESDLPVTDANVSAVLGALAMSSEIGHMSQDSFAYIIRNDLKPTINTIYRSVYSGNVRRDEIYSGDWEAIRPQIEEVVGEAKTSYPGIKLEAQDARELLEYDIAVTEQNLHYKKELEALRDNPPSEDYVIRAAVRAIDRGDEASDAIMIDSFETRPNRRVSELVAEISIHEIRLLMSADAREQAAMLGIGADEEAIQSRIDELRAQVRDFYEGLAEEMDIPKAQWSEAVSLAVETQSAVDNIATAPVTLYGATLSIRESITVERLSIEASAVRTAAVGSYEASQTQIRSDLGDSIGKAFRNIDSLLEQEGMDVTEANIRAVKILGHNEMEITEQNINTIKYYDAKVTSMVEGLRPAMVMAMIRRGYNPLEDDVDTVLAHIRDIREEEGESPEEKFSSFLVRMDENGTISEDERATYIGIYRLLYQIEKSDGAAIGAALNSGRKLTLRNLLTEARTRRSDRVDERIDDESDIRSATYSNSITDQIEQGFVNRFPEETEYNLNLIRESLAVTEPETWETALAGQKADELTCEQVAQALKANDNPAMQRPDDAARIRNVMASMSSARNFLKAFGIADSVNNTEILDEVGEDLSMRFADRSELISTVEDEQKLKKAFADSETESAEEASEMLLSAADIRGRGDEIRRVMKRYGLLNSLAQREHYRMRVEGDRPARINLTVLHSAERSGSVSIEVSTETYHARASFELTDEGEQLRAYGHISFDSSDEFAAAFTAVARFRGRAKAEGIDTEGVSEGIDRISPDMYLARLAEAKRLEDGTQPTDSQLYRIARIFIEEMI